MRPRRCRPGGPGAGRAAGGARWSPGPPHRAARRSPARRPSRRRSRASGRDRRSRRAAPSRAIAGRDRLLDGVRPVQEVAPAGAAAAQVDPAEPDAPRRRCSLEPGEPGVVAAVVVRAPPCRPASLSQSSTYAAGSTHLALDDEGVAVGARARPRAARPRGGPASIDPVGQHLAPAALGEVGGRGADDGLDHPVAGQAGVAVDAAARRSPARSRTAGWWRPGRTARRATGSKSEPSRTSTRSRTSLSAALNRGQPQRARVHVGGDDRRAWRGQVQGLDAAAGAEVEAPGRPARGSSAGPARSTRG